VNNECEFGVTRAGDFVALGEGIFSPMTFYIASMLMRCINRPDLGYTAKSADAQTISHTSVTEKITFVCAAVAFAE
jgi:hypothetical protein